MNKVWNFLILLLAVILCSCGDDDLDNLTGSWTFGSAFVDGTGTTAAGVIDFNADNRGSADFYFLIASDTLRKQGSFTYS